MTATAIGVATVFMGAWLLFWCIIVNVSYEGQLDTVILGSIFVVLAGVVFIALQWTLPAVCFNLFLGLVLGVLFLPTWRDNEGDRPGRMMAVLMMLVPGAVGLGSGVAGLVKVLGG